MQSRIFAVGMLVVIAMLSPAQAPRAINLDGLSGELFHDPPPPLDVNGCHKDQRGYYHCH